MFLFLFCSLFDDFAVEGSVFQDNFAQENGGGVMINSLTSEVVMMTNTVFDQNIGRGEGGAVYSTTAWNARDCRFLGNTGGLGGAISSLVRNADTNTNTNTHTHIYTFIILFLLLFCLSLLLHPIHLLSS